MAEIAPAGGGPNRLFIVIALGLVGLLLIGLIAVAGILFIPRIFSTASPTRPIVITTPTRAVAAAVTEAPADTDTPPASATFVIGGTSAPEAGMPGVGAIAATATITGTPGAGGTLPKSGLGEDLVLLAGGIVLVLIIFAARRARATTAA